MTSASSVLAECYEFGREVICYASLEDCVECLAQLLADPERCKSVGEAARERSLRDHTWDRRLRDLLSLWRKELIPLADSHQLMSQIS